MLHRRKVAAPLGQLHAKIGTDGCRRRIAGRGHGQRFGVGGAAHGNQRIGNALQRRPGMGAAPLNLGPDVQR
jgi:hypothetical protein